MANGELFAKLHYFLALAQLAGRRPGRLPQNEVQKIEGRLRQASRDPTSSHARLLYAFVKHDFYVRNCMRIEPPTHVQLLREAASTGIPLSRLQELLRHTPIAVFIHVTRIRRQ